MACRVGITTDLEARKKHWESKYPNMKNWSSYGPYDSKEEAQAQESAFADICSCEAHPGGRDPDDPSAKWHVYYFEF